MRCKNCFFCSFNFLIFLKKIFFNFFFSILLLQYLIPFVLFSSVFLFYFFHLFLVSFIFKFRIYYSYTATNQPPTSCLIVDENFETHVDFHKFSILCESISLAVLYKFFFLCFVCTHKRKMIHIFIFISYIFP